MRDFPVRALPGIAWEIRAAWAKAQPVVLVLDEEWCAVPRVGGVIVSVATTDASLLINDGFAVPLHVPLSMILAVRRPHFSEPSDAAALAGVPSGGDSRQLALWDGI